MVKGFIVCPGVQNKYIEGLSGPRAGLPAEHPYAHLDYGPACDLCFIIISPAILEDPCNATVHSYITTLSSCGYMLDSRLLITGLIRDHRAWLWQWRLIVSSCSVPEDHIRDQEGSNHLSLGSSIL